MIVPAIGVFGNPVEVRKPVNHVRVFCSAASFGLSAIKIIALPAQEGITIVYNWADGSCTAAALGHKIPIRVLIFHLHFYSAQAVALASDITLSGGIFIVLLSGNDNKRFVDFCYLC